MSHNINLKAGTITGGVAIGDNPVAYGQGNIVTPTKNEPVTKEPEKAADRPFLFLGRTVWTIILGIIGSIIAAMIYSGK